MEAGSTKYAVFNQPSDPLYYTKGPPMAGEPCFSQRACRAVEKHFCVFTSHTLGDGQLCGHCMDENTLRLRGQHGPGPSSLLSSRPPLEDICLDMGSPGTHTGGHSGTQTRGATRSQRAGREGVCDSWILFPSRRSVPLGGPWERSLVPPCLSRHCPKGNSSHHSARQVTGGPGKSLQAFFSASASHPEFCRTAEQGW